MQIQLTEAESRAVAERPIDNPAAYDCYLQARHELRRAREQVKLRWQAFSG